MDHTSEDKTSTVIQPVPPPSRWRRRIRWLTAIACALYLPAVLGFWFFFYVDGDRWWPATMCLFSARWILLIPLLLLAPLAAFHGRRWLGLLLFTAVIVLWPIMDLRITRGGLFPPERKDTTVRVLTFNTHFDTTDPEKLKALIDQTKPDIVALQEWYPYNRKIFLSDPKWYTVQKPEAMLASPYPIRLLGESIGEADVSAGVTYHYAITLPSREISLYSVHLSSPHAAFRSILRLNRAGPARLTFNSIRRIHEANNLRRLSDDDTILAGDFNLPRDSTIFRSALAKFSDAFTEAGLGWGLTYYSRFTTVRIDHVLMGQNWRCTHCWVGPNIGSPHRPVIADLEPVVH